MTWRLAVSLALAALSGVTLVLAFTVDVTFVSAAGVVAAILAP